MKKSIHASNEIATTPAPSSSESSDAATAQAQSPNQDPGAQPPKASSSRTPPKDWKPAKLGRGNGARARKAQASNAAVAGKELATSATYAADFGPHAPSQAQLGRLMVTAAAWRQEWLATKRWASYAAAENASWWAATLESASLFQPAFDYAVARDPSIAERYPSATQFMQAASAIGKRAASARKAGTKATAGGKANAAQADTEASGATSAAQPTAVTPVQPASDVTPNAASIPAK